MFKDNALFCIAHFKPFAKFATLNKKAKRMDNFLPFFKRGTINHIMKDTKGNREKLYFQIAFDEQQHAFVSIINGKGIEINPDYRLYNGEAFHVLRSIDTIRKEQHNHFSWDETDNHIYLKEYPYLLYQLLRCDNLVSTNFDPISVSTETAVPQLLIDKKGEQISTSFSLRTEGKEIVGFQFLTDIFVLADNSIYPIRSVGENYDKLDFFKSSFPEHLLEKYLSVFYSYMENMPPIYEDYSLVYWWLSATGCFEQRWLHSRGSIWGDKKHQ